MIDLADEFALAVVSSRDEQERAGIVVLEPPPGQVTVPHRVAAQPRRHGHRAQRAGATQRRTRPPSDETLEMLRAAFVSYGTAASY